VFVFKKSNSSSDEALLSKPTTIQQTNFGTRN